MSASRFATGSRKQDLLSYLEASMRVYNRHGRRDNKYKARIKILVNELGPDEYRRQVDEEFANQNAWEKVVLPQAEIDRIRAYFAPPVFEALAGRSDAFDTASGWITVLRAGRGTICGRTRTPGYASVHVSLKPKGVAPGDATSDQMRGDRGARRTIWLRRNPRRA